MYINIILKISPSLLQSEPKLAEPDYPLTLIEYIDNEKQLYRNRLPENMVLEDGELVYKTNPGEAVTFTCPVDKNDKVIKKISKYYWGFEHCLVEKEVHSSDYGKCAQPMEPLLLTMGLHETERVCGPTQMDFLLRFVYVV